MKTRSRNLVGSRAMGGNATEGLSAPSLKVDFVGKAACRETRKKGTIWDAYLVRLRFDSAKYRSQC